MTKCLLISLSLKFFSIIRFWSYVKKAPKAFIGSSGHLIPKGLISLYSNDPIHNPSVLESLTFTLRAESLSIFLDKSGRGK